MTHNYHNETAIRLVKNILARGYSISVVKRCDEGIDRSTNEAEIIDALRSEDGCPLAVGIIYGWKDTGESAFTDDSLWVCNAEGRTVGWCSLISDNGSSGDELISDCATNDLCNKICDEVPAMIKPIININGSGRANLIKPRRAAMDALLDAVSALREVIPNGRDYPSDDDRWMVDRQIQSGRITALLWMREELLQEALLIQNGEDA